MLRILTIIILFLYTSGCERWDRAVYATDHRDARVNILNEKNDPVNMIYVGVSDNKSEAFFKKVYETSVLYKGAQHVAPKEVIARQQCVKNFSLEKPVFKKMLEITKEQKKKYKLSFKRYAKYLCEKSEMQLAYEQQEKKKNKSSFSKNTKKRSFICSYSVIPSEKSKILIDGPKAYETTAIGVQIKYSNVKLSDKGAFSLQGASNDPGRAWFIGSQSFLLLDTDMLPYNCN